ncbi:MAG TPA: DNA modification methylase [Bacteroidetes bacterium]|nr:DNA modification methylase [Bacteroidota bacterium]
MKGLIIPRFTSEFWTPRQRQASPLHEISYRACFKPQLPRYFIERLTTPDDVIYDPFMGRGTTVIEAVLLGRGAIGNDINPLCRILTEPRLNVPALAEIEERLRTIDFDGEEGADIDLSMFYHRKTEAEIVSLRNYLARRKRTLEEDGVDRWIRMVATNRLTGHSAGFFSVYTLPPNQAASQASQEKINKKRMQSPPYRDVKKLILRKSVSLLGKLSRVARARTKNGGARTILLNSDAWHTPEIKDEFVRLTVTSPPFLDIVNYSQDNWLRCWFNDIDPESIGGKITIARSVEDWARIMQKVFVELFRITAHRGFVAFEVGEIRKRNIKLDEVIAPLGVTAGFRCLGILINLQRFTKTSNIWGVNNNEAGTNTNRIVLLQKT